MGRIHMSFFILYKCIKIQLSDKERVGLVFSENRMKTIASSFYYSNLFAFIYLAYLTTWDMSTILT